MKLAGELIDAVLIPRESQSESAKTSEILFRCRLVSQKEINRNELVKALVSERTGMTIATSNWALKHVKNGDTIKLMGREWLVDNAGLGTNIGWMILGHFHSSIAEKRFPIYITLC